MATTEQFSLRWNNFHSNLTASFHQLLAASELVDVTLAVDGHFFQAHKLVLSICSPYFKQMFKVNPCKHPIVILKDVAHENMKDILEFMYMGEVNVLKENLPTFLRTAELLQVKGLTGDDSQSETSSRKDDKSDSIVDNEEDPDLMQFNQLIDSDVELPAHYSNPRVPTPPPVTQSAPPPMKRQPKNTNSNNNCKRSKMETTSNQSTKAVKAELEPTTVSQLNTSDGSDHTEPYKLEKSMSDNDDTKDNLKNNMIDANIVTPGDSNTGDQAACITCGKIMRKSSIRRHMIDVHFPTQQLPCDLCHKLFKTANSLTTHLITIHKQLKSDRNKFKITVI